MGSTISYHAFEEQATWCLTVLLFQFKTEVSTHDSSWPMLELDMSYSKGS